MMFIVILACAVAMAEAQICNLNVAQQPNFSPQQFAGNWHLGLMSPQVGLLVYNLTVGFVWSPAVGSTVNVTATIKYVNYNLVNDKGQWNATQGNATFTVKFTDILDLVFSGTYVVACTDYVTYATIKGCSVFFPNAVYVLYRDAHPNSTVVNNSKQNLTSCVGIAGQDLVADPSVVSNTPRFRID